MGIYASDKILGIKIYFYNDDDCKTNILLEEKYDKEITGEQMKKARLFYDNLEENIKNKCKMSVYTEASTSYNPNNHGSFMMWYPLPKENFLCSFSV